jgi:hypothetical protein
MENYLIVLFENKVKKKIIKKYITYNKAKTFYNKLLLQSNEIIFRKEIVGGNESSFELGLVELSSKQLLPIYITDEMGRSVKVKLENDNMTLVEISPYNIEETIWDVSKSRKITVKELITKYLKKDGVKLISSIHNKVVVQNNEVINLFTLKTEQESHRFLDCISSYFFKIKRGDCIFVKDTSNAQRKEIFSLLEKNGFSKQRLYRKFTTFPPLK